MGEDWQLISSKIRNNIFDGIRLAGVCFSGELGDVDFLSRLYDLEALPSYDTRYSTANDDIYMHRDFNFDWEDDWIFSDKRFGLLRCNDEKFLRFLCETVHPVVRPDREQALELVEHYNDQLSLAGIQLVEAEKIAGRAVYIAKKSEEFQSKINRATSAAEILQSNWMQTEIDRIQNSVESDPALAIGTSKDLVESCCKAILDEFNIEVSPKDDLPTLSKKMCKVLGLVPEGIPSEAKGAEIIKRTLSNLTSVTKGIAELRGLYGSGHGRDGNHYGLEPRHARLAASCAIAFVDFATATYMKRR